MKTAREPLHIRTACQELGSYRAAAASCGTTRKAVRRQNGKGVVTVRSRMRRPIPAATVGLSSDGRTWQDDVEPALDGGSPDDPGVPVTLPAPETSYSGP